jgi:hypothetical protein
MNHEPGEVLSVNPTLRCKGVPAALSLLYKNLYSVAQVNCDTGPSNLEIDYTCPTWKAQVGKVVAPSDSRYASGMCKHLLTTSEPIFLMKWATQLVMPPKVSHEVQSLL